jgi:hypothetical protein
MRDHEEGAIIQEQQQPVGWVERTTWRRGSAEPHKERLVWRSLL